jgi:hypothetical protein
VSRRAIARSKLAPDTPPSLRTGREGKRRAHPRAGPPLGSFVLDGGLGIGESDLIEDCVVMPNGILVITGSYARTGGVDRDGFVAAFPGG